MKKQRGQVLDVLLIVGIVVSACYMLIVAHDSKAGEPVPRAALQYQRSLISAARGVWGLNAPVATFAGQVHQESQWNAAAKSSYAAGLAQFTPATSDWISAKYATELGANQPYDPAWSLRALARYDKFLHDRVTAAVTPCDRMLFALSDYNGGAGWRMRRQARAKIPGDYATASVINPGIAAASQKENQEYPRRIVYRWQPIYAGWGPGVCA